MKRFLLDTQVLIWLLIDQQKLSKPIQNILLDPQNEVFASQISLFEIVIKQTIGKLPNFSVDTISLVQQVKTDGFHWLPLQNIHLSAYPTIPLLANHRDPFDRLLLATAFAENMSLISADAKLLDYATLVKVVW